MLLTPLGEHTGVVEGKEWAALLQLDAELPIADERWHELTARLVALVGEDGRQRLDQLTGEAIGAAQRGGSDAQALVAELERRLDALDLDPDARNLHEARVARTFEIATAIETGQAPP